MQMQSVKYTFSLDNFRPRSPQAMLGSSWKTNLTLRAALLQKNLTLL